ncbi:sugar phosphate isomerase/epimerase family protein [Eudoraea chungangensis]|uniref:sugar phosphate isomerase/epimerase family protein n=1 Tax=Eudoraea chungangensis TaxID=1481905 RepID=UPI0023EE098A|nr:sugar phosphate isomerase/epimerase [Eudoraea chungangensis]
MTSRRSFIVQVSAFSAASLLLPSVVKASPLIGKMGVQLYSFRKEMLKNPAETLKQIASLGITEIETARSQKGHYYGLQPEKMKQVCEDLGMNLKSGHVHLDDSWEKTMNEAVRSGQEYLICSSLPSKGQTVENYKKVAEAFNKAGEACKSLGLKFGYHNHDYEFDSDGDKVLYNILLENTDADLVHMELDLGWVITAGKNPLDYFKNYPGRFPLWHLKDMNLSKKESTEFGKGGLDIKAMLANKKSSGVRHIFIEQEEYASTPLESMRYNMNYLKNIS